MWIFHINHVYERKMKYPEIVAKAGKIAKMNFTSGIVVYQNLDSQWWNKTSKYGYCSQRYFHKLINSGSYPLIKLLLIMPCGNIVQ